MILPMPTTLPSPISFLVLLPKPKFYNRNKLFVVLLIPIYAFTCVLMPELTYFLSSLSLLTFLLFNYYSSNHVLWKPFLKNLPTPALKHTYTLNFLGFFFFCSFVVVSSTCLYCSNYHTTYYLFSLLSVYGEL